MKVDAPVISIVAAVPGVDELIVSRSFESNQSMLSVPTIVCVTPAGKVIVLVVASFNASANVRLFHVVAPVRV